jgi:hypothetical protein
MWLRELYLILLLIVEPDPQSCLLEIKKIKINAFILLFDLVFPKNTFSIIQKKKNIHYI